MVHWAPCVSSPHSHGLRAHNQLLTMKGSLLLIAIRLAPTRLKALPWLLSPLSGPQARWGRPPGLSDSCSWSLPLKHSAPAKTCLHSPLRITGTQAALHWLFSPAETILPPKRSQTHPLLQVFVLLSLNMLAPISHLPTSGCLPPASLLHCPSSHLLQQTVNYTLLCIYYSQPPSTL